MVFCDFYATLHRFLTINVVFFPKGI